MSLILMTWKVDNEPASILPEDETIYFLVKLGKMGQNKDTRNMFTQSSDF